LSVEAKPNIALKQTYKPEKPLGELLLESKAIFQAITEMDHIVSESLRVAEDRVARIGLLDIDEGLALVLYSFDLQTLSECPRGSDNFYYVVNEVFRTREFAQLMALRPFVYHFRAAWQKLPPVQGTFYRGVERSSAEVIGKEYKQGRHIHWAAITSLSGTEAVARRFALKCGDGGVLLVVQVVDGRDIAAFSAIPPEDEVLLAPDTKLVVTEPLSAGSGGVSVVRLQQLLPGTKFKY